MTHTQLPVGLLTCQHTPYLKEFTTTVISCSPKPNKQKLYEVKVQDTILFPEGGGQPCDYGTINETIEVKNVQRVGTEHVHHTTAPLAPGTEAHMKVNWDRRFDNMQQHSGQHLLSAILEQPQFGCDTLAWAMNDKRGHVELSKAPTPEQVIEVERLCNMYIRHNCPVQVTFVEERPSTMPKDYVGPNGVYRVLQIMRDLDAEEEEAAGYPSSSGLPLEARSKTENGELGAMKDLSLKVEEERVKKGLVRLDYNPCCGSHVKSLKDLQCIKLLHMEKIRGSNVRLFFVVGQRALTLLQETYQMSRDLAAVISAPGGLETYVDTVSKLQKQGRDVFKQAKNLWKEIAEYKVKEIVDGLNKPESLAKEETSGKGILIKFHREDADLDFLTLLSVMLKDHTDGVLTPKRVFMLSAGEMKEGGSMIISGQDEALVKAVAAEVVKNVEVKGGGKGRWQGKSKSWKGLDKAYEAVEQLLQ